MDDATHYAVRLVARNYVVPWPSPVWWRFWEKLPRRKGFQVTLEVPARSAAEAARLAELEIRSELDLKAQNDPTDPYQLEVIEAVRVTEPIQNAGFKQWFGESADAEL